jgi:hypothetical protein
MFVGKGTFINCRWECKLVLATMENQYGSSSEKLKTELPYYLAITQWL